MFDNLTEFVHYLIKNKKQYLNEVMGCISGKNQKGKPMVYFQILKMH